MSRFTTPLSSSPIPSATESVSGVVRYTTNAESAASASTTVAEDPVSLAASLNAAAGPSVLQSSVVVALDKAAIWKDRAAIRYFYGTVVPSSGYLLADGRSTAGYPALISRYGANLPNLIPAQSWVQSTLGTDPFSYAGLCVASDGNIYGARGAGSSVYKITKAGVTTLFVTLSSSGNQTGICQGADTNIYSLLSTTGVITRITLAGVQTVVTSSLPIGGWALTQGTDTNLYVSKTSTNTIYQVTLAGVISTFATIPGSGDLFGLTSHSDGNLYASTLSGLLCRVTLAGVVTTVSSSIETFPIALTSTGPSLFVGRSSFSELGSQFVSSYRFTPTTYTTSAAYDLYLGDTIYTSSGGFSGIRKFAKSPQLLPYVRTT